MKRFVALAAVLLTTAFVVLTQSLPVAAQDPVWVTPDAQSDAEVIVNARILSTTSVELGDEVFRVSELEVTSNLKGSTDDTILVATRGGTRSDGLTMYLSLIHI